MPDEEIRYQSYETYEKFRIVIAVIAAIVGTILFRVNVLSGWHMSQDIKDGDGGPIIYFIVAIFTEILPYIVAVIPGGGGGYIVGMVGGAILSLVFMLLATISTALSNNWDAHLERKYLRQKNKAKDYLTEFCNSKEKVIQILQNLLQDKDCQNIYSDCAKLFNHIGNTDIYEEYTKQKLISEQETIESAKKIANDYGIEINIDSWSLYNLFNWCNTEKSKVEGVRSQISDAELEDLERMIEEM